MELRLTPEQHRQIADHATATRPEECCGILVGTRDRHAWRVTRVVPVNNVWDGPRENRFMLDPLAYVKEEKRAQTEGHEVVGFFHSHPNGIAVPSAFDTELAWPDMAFAIVPIRDRHTGPLRCWCLPEDETEFVEVEVILTPA
jgi:proteasome lid subunit RPN8/RPN11